MTESDAAARRAELLRIAYSRDSPPVKRREAELELTAMAVAAESSRERAAERAAELASTFAPPPPSAQNGRMPSAMVLAETSLSAPGSADAGAPEPASPRSRVVLIAAASAAAVVILLGGIVLGSGLNRTAGSGAATASSAPSPSVSPLNHPRNSLPGFVIFDRPQTPDDIPDIAAAGNFQEDTFRALDTGQRYSTGRLSPVFVVRGYNRDVCLVAVTIDRGFASSCSPVSDFPDTGLQLTWSITTPSGVGEQGYTFDSVGWLPDGTVTWGDDGPRI